MEKVNLAASFARFSETFSPRSIGELNGQRVKLVRRTASSSGTTTKPRTSFSWWSKGAW